MDKNVDYEVGNIEIVSGDTWDMTFNVHKKNPSTGVWEDYDLSGKIVDIGVDDMDGVEMLSLSSTGISPAITISGSAFNILYDNAFTVTEKTKYKYDVQVTDGTHKYTVRKGYLYVTTDVVD